MANVSKIAIVDFDFGQKEMILGFYLMSSLKIVLCQILVSNVSPLHSKVTVWDLYLTTFFPP